VGADLNASRPLPNNVSHVVPNRGIGSHWRVGVLSWEPVVLPRQRERWIKGTDLYIPGHARVVDVELRHSLEPFSCCRGPARVIPCITHIAECYCQSGMGGDGEMGGLPDVFPHWCCSAIDEEDSVGLLREGR
jgi:hypothetical protein